MTELQDAWFERALEAFRGRRYAHAYLYLKLCQQDAIGNNQSVAFNLTLLKQRIPAARRLELDQALAEQRASVLIGKLESFTDWTLRGWAIDELNAEQPQTLRVFLNDLHYSDLLADEPKPGLRKRLFSGDIGGFNLRLPPALFKRKAQKITVEYADKTRLSEWTTKQRASLPQDYTPLKLPALNSPSVVIDAGDLHGRNLCQRFEALLRNVAPQHPVHVLCSLTQAQTLTTHAEFTDRLTIHASEVEQCVAAFAELTATLAQDWVWLNADTEQAPNWLRGLRYRASTQTALASLSAVSNRPGVFSALPQTLDLSSIIAAERPTVLQSVRRYAHGIVPEVPVVNTDCVYLVQAQWRSFLNAHQQHQFATISAMFAAFAQFARSQGNRHLIADNTLVWSHDTTPLHDPANAQAGDYDPETWIALQRCESDYRMLGVRYQVQLAATQMQSEARPRALYVVATLTGGTPQTNQDLMAAVSDRYQPWLLHCDSKILSLYRRREAHEEAMRGDDLAGFELLERVQLPQHISPLLHTSAEYDRLLSHWLQDYDFELLHVRHLAWHSLNLPRIAKSLGLAVFHSFHDFYTVCPTIKLLDGDEKFCAGDCSRSNAAEPCEPDLWPHGAFPTLKQGWVQRWQQQMNAALAVCDGFFTTHAAAKALIEERLSLPQVPFTVIAHGRDFTRFADTRAVKVAAEPLQILLPGNITAAKGGTWIKRLLAHDQEQRLHFHVLGHSNVDLEHPQITFHGNYERDDFVERVAAIRPHVGAVFSIWQETWCHTLTEMWAAGLPVIAFEYATVAERIRQAEAGWVLPDAATAQLYDALVAISQAPQDIADKGAAVLRWQQEAGQQGTVARMAAAYLSAYEKTVASR